MMMLGVGYGRGAGHGFVEERVRSKVKSDLGDNKKNVGFIILWDWALGLNGPR